MTDLLFRSDPYLQESAAVVTAHTPEGGVVLDQAIFYATGGGQPGDSGRLTWDGNSMPIATTIKGEAGQIVLLPSEPVPLPPVGSQVTQVLDWDRRHRHMRVHTALHLLSVVIQLPVTGGSIGADKGRLDFNMPEALADKDVLNARLNDLIAQDLPVTEGWITDAELAANPSLLKTMSVQPPKGTGRVRLIGIGAGDAQIDLQPCGGTHVAHTGEIGPVHIGKVQNKGAQNRRVYLHLDG